MKDQRSEDSRINISVKNGNLSKKKPDSKNPEKQHPVVLHEINDIHTIILLHFMYLYYLYHVFTVNTFHVSILLVSRFHCEYTCVSSFIDASTRGLVFQRYWYRFSIGFYFLIHSAIFYLILSMNLSFSGLTPCNNCFCFLIL
jgi:membrane-associated HD superfamily phosphohydrolase